MDPLSDSFKNITNMVEEECNKSTTVHGKPGSFKVYRSPYGSIHEDFPPEASVGQESYTLVSRSTPVCMAKDAASRLLNEAIVRSVKNIGTAVCVYKAAGTLPALMMLVTSENLDDVRTVGVAAIESFISIRNSLKKTLATVEAKKDDIFSVKVSQESDGTMECVYTSKFGTYVFDDDSSAPVDNEERTGSVNGFISDLTILDESDFEDKDDCDFVPETHVVVD